MSKKHIIIASILAVVIVAGALFYMSSKDSDDTYQSTTYSTNETVMETATANSDTSGLPPCQSATATGCDHNKKYEGPSGLEGGVEAGMAMSNNNCTGEEKPKLTHLPMNADDFAFILPYGLMVGGHVTPIDHQYFSPTVFDSKPDAYDVFAMADSYIVDIGTRQHPGQGQNKNITITDYRLVFAMSCKLFYYYDLVTELAPGLQEQFDASGSNLAVKAGQVIGKIGGQTLDFAVWDMDVDLPGLLVAETYSGESWKLYTADPLDYYTDEIKAVTLSKYLRTAEPVSGKIDYDIDGKLVGNWFQVGSNGYAGPGGGVDGYWNGHLAIAPDYIDPTKYEVSIGNWPGGASQFAVIGNTPDPTGVGVGSGLVKYDLGTINYMVGNKSWDRKTIQGPMTMQAGTPSQGCFLAEMIDVRSLKGEAFKGKTCANVTGFTSAAVMYER